MTNKVIQIALCFNKFGENSALQEDGTIWERQYRGSLPWLKHPPIPKENEITD